MHYKMRKMKINNSKIYVTICPSNVYPYTYWEEKYAPDKGLPTAIVELLVSMMSGNIVPHKNLHVAKVLKKMREIEGIDTVSNLNDDFRFQTDRVSNLHKLIAKNYGVHAVLDWYFNVPEERRNSNSAFNHTCLLVYRYKAESARLYEQLEKKATEKNIIFVESAIRSSVYPGYDILYRSQEDECVIAKAENYDNHGRLDNSDQSAIFLGSGTGRAFGFLGGSFIDREDNISVCREIENMIDWDLLSHIPMVQKPYPKFGNKEDESLQEFTAVIYVDGAIEIRVEAKSADDAIKEAMRVVKNADFNEMKLISSEPYLLKDCNNQIIDF